MFTASRPVMPWMIKVVSLSMRIDILSRSYLGHSPTGRLVHGDRAVTVLDPVFPQNLGSFALPGAGNAEDGDLLGRVEPGLHHTFDDASGHDVRTSIAHYAHHDRDLLDAWLGEDELGQL